MAPIYHIIIVRVICTSWAHIWRLHFCFLGMGYDILKATMLSRTDQHKEKSEQETIMSGLHGTFIHLGLIFTLE
jgi:hypothetical protein